MIPPQTGSTAVVSTPAKTAVKKSIKPVKSATKPSSASKKPVAKTAASKTSANHPTYIQMITRAILELKEKNGSSRQAILKVISSKFNVVVDPRAQSQLKMALKRGLASGLLKQSKGSGAAGSFKVNAEAKKSAKPKAAATKKPVVEKSSPSKSAGVVKAAKKPVTTKAASTKSTSTVKASKKVTKRPESKTAATKKPAVRKEGVTKKAVAAKPKVAKAKTISTKPAVASKAKPATVAKPKTVVTKKKVTVKKAPKTSAK